MKKDGNYLTRRELIKGATGMGMVRVMSPLAGFDNFKPQKKGLIVEGNNKKEILIDNLLLWSQIGYRFQPIVGYCSKNSLRPGDLLDIFLSTQGVSEEKRTTDVTFNFYRIG